ncbi:GntR family transcriptional regulator [Streptomyces fulvoviolaceus]|uniref:GntR family transcriptional regulator n=1 Tax=Streptomyces fulvoviolaceus TaxID=285535 RepID=UPI0021BF08FC|nr:GntR family transcriptional regulator [Streptomyces fulvoviolaceus]MCT9083126.1 GntR family transcriptional regulator [Streptomyces fulvoviolaceus]
MSEDDLPVIDPSGPQLVYMVVADHIAGQIVSGKLKPGTRLPGELAMAATYGIARMTVARAVRELRERGVVHTVRGKGTFVREQPPEASDVRTANEAQD